MQVEPTVVIVRTSGGSDDVEQQCRRENIPVDVFNFAGDYYSLPNLVPDAFTTIEARTADGDHGLQASPAEECIGHVREFSKNVVPSFRTGPRFFVHVSSRNINNHCINTTARWST